MPPALLTEKVLDISFTVPGNRVHLTGIATGFFTGPWDIDLADKKFGSEVSLPKHARAKEACAVVFHVGEPETGLVQTGCRTSLRGTTSAIQRLKSFDLSNVTSSRVSGALNSLSDHVTDMDIKGAVREANGVLEGNHATGELKDAVNSLSNLKDSLQGALQNPHLTDNTRAGFTQAVQAINNFVQSAQPVIDQARKQQAAQ